MTATTPEPTAAPAPADVMARAATENFTVASRLLPARERRHLLALYGFARLVDELGDSFGGDREAALTWLADELDRAFAGAATHPLMVRVQGTIRACALPREPFARLIEANRQDQRVRRYETWEQLRAYCALSADPVGELVLGVFGLATPERVALSDRICTALQLIEHCQDVAEDLAAGRVYLPLEDLERFGASVEQLSRPHAGPELCAVLAFEARRASGLLDEGSALLAQLHGRPRLGVAAYVAGGRAALTAIARARYDVLAGAPAASRALRLRALAATLARAPGRAR